MTISGPQPLERRRAPLDYQHYIERQLQPVADAILPFVRDEFTKLIDPNPGLF
jgi:DNA polymerase-2